MASINSIFESHSYSQQLWINQISDILEEEVQIDVVSIFRVPADLSASNPKAYVPQLIALGPYHHFRPELYEMERYKLAAASRVQKQFQSGLEFKDLVAKLKEIEHIVRGCYHKYLDMKGETLAWIMAIDGLFLLIFLNSYINKDCPSPFPAAAHLVGDAGKRLGNGAILSDVLMLENQIPILVLSSILSIQCPSIDIGNNFLPYMLVGFCRAVSPLKLRENLPSSQVLGHAHLLDLLYHLTVPKLEGENQSSCNVVGGKGGSSLVIETQSFNSSYSHHVFTRLCSFASRVNVDIVRKITEITKKIAGGSWKVVTTLRGTSSSAANKKEIVKPESEKSTSVAVVEEIMIPPASLLCAFGVEFCPTSGDITTIKFDPRERKFHLPVISLNVHSEVIMRNIVAYEASVSESLVFARYTELMSGIIDTAEDAKLLREKKIIVNSLKSDADVAELFNGMSKAVRLTNVQYIDKAIEDVNKYFYSTPRVRAYISMRKYVFGSWKVLTVLAVILLMLLTGLESFCSVYSCLRLFHTTIGGGL